MSADFKDLTHDDLVKLWPLAAKELAGFANHLHQTNAGLTADQLQMAIQMAERYFQLSNAVYTAIPSYQYAGFPGGAMPAYAAAVSIDQLKNAMSLIEQYYQIFNTVLGVIGPLLQKPASGSLPK